MSDACLVGLTGTLQLGALVATLEAAKSARPRSTDGRFLSRREMLLDTRDSLVDLVVAINAASGSEFAMTLVKVYSFAHNRVLEAMRCAEAGNEPKARQHLDGALAVIRPLLSAWSEADSFTNNR